MDNPGACRQKLVYEQSAQLHAPTSGKLLEAEKSLAGLTAHLTKLPCSIMNSAAYRQGANLADEREDQRAEPGRFRLFGNSSSGMSQTSGT